MVFSFIPIVFLSLTVFNRAGPGEYLRVSLRIQENIIPHLIDKGKPVVKRGRKAASLMHRYKIVGLPVGIKPSLDGDGFFHP